MLNWSQIKYVRHFPNTGIKLSLLPFENGLEFAAHEKITKILNRKIFFADPYSLCQLGMNGNTNGLIRQYFPMGSDFENCTQDDVSYAMNSLNNRP